MKIGRIFYKIFIIASIFCFKSYQVQSLALKDIEVSGNDRIQTKNIIQQAGLKIGGHVTKNDLNKALKNIYQTGNFADVSVDQDKNGNVKINVVETPIIGDVYFTGNLEGIDEDEIKKNLATQPRQIYSTSRIKFDRDRLYFIFNKMGYKNIHIEPRVVFLQNNSVDIIFNFSLGEISHIKNILFTGNKHFSDGTLRDNLLSKERMMLSLTDRNGGFEEEKIDTDKRLLKVFYQNKGYAKIDISEPTITYDKRNNDLTILWQIDEGEKYLFSGFKINTSMNKFKEDADLINKISIKKEKNFSLNEINQSITNMTVYLQTKGYSNISVDYDLDFDDEKHSTEVIFNINFTQKVYIDRIKISGNHKTKDYVILREMMIHEGDIYDKSKIDLSRDRIFMLGYFKNVDIKENPIPNSDLLELEIVVEEQFFGNINFSIGYSGYYGIVGSINLTLNNFLGRGYTVGLGVNRNGYMENYNLQFFDPYFLNNTYNIGFGVNVYFSRFGDLGGGTSYISNLFYKGYNYGGLLTFSFELAERLRLQLNVGYSNYIYKNLGAGGYKLYQQFFGTRTSYTFGFDVTYNRMNRARFATKGYLLQYSFNSGSFGIKNAQQFMQNIVSAVGNIQIFGENLIFHLEGSAGLTTSLKKNQILSTAYLYSLGGYAKMRGFNFSGIGPRIQISDTLGRKTQMYYSTDGTQFYYLSAALRSPLMIPKDYGIYFSAFVDAGATWGFAGNEKIAYYWSIVNNYLVINKEEILDSSKIRVSAGIGITWNSPLIGEIGFYYAKPIVKQPYDTTLEFGIKMGHQF